MRRTRRCYHPHSGGRIAPFSPHRPMTELHFTAAPEEVDQEEEEKEEGRGRGGEERDKE